MKTAWTKHTFAWNMKAACWSKLVNDIWERCAKEHLWMSKRVNDIWERCAKANVWMKYETVWLQQTREPNLKTMWWSKLVSTIIRCLSEQICEQNVTTICWSKRVNEIRKLRAQANLWMKYATWVSAQTCDEIWKPCAEANMWISNLVNGTMQRGCFSELVNELWDLTWVLKNLWMKRKRCLLKQAGEWTMKPEWSSKRVDEIYNLGA
jgi:hypothetical protein